MSRPQLCPRYPFIYCQDVLPSRKISTRQIWVLISLFPATLDGHRTACKITERSNKYKPISCDVKISWVLVVRRLIAQWIQAQVWYVYRVNGMKGSVFIFCAQINSRPGAQYRLKAPDAQEKHRLKCRQCAEWNRKMVYVNRAHRSWGWHLAVNLSLMFSNQIADKYRCNVIYIESDILCARLLVG